jgi:16S rRNA (uracil1498-N3)-methyltransferase
VRRRFFVSQFHEDAATIEGSAAHHLARVLRAERGQLYELSDGNAVNLARVERVSSERVDFALLESLPTPARRLEATLLLAVVKFDRFEWALEKATELGAATIVPLAAARSEKALRSAAPKRAARWEKILFESAQQARCLWPPRLLGLTTPGEAFSADSSLIRILLSERADDPRMRTLLETSSTAARDGSPAMVSMAIGPEGGWTDDEFGAAEAAGFTPACLGHNILRTETAVIAALAAAHLWFD